MLPKSLPSFGPQDIERGVSSPVPGELVESFLCAILSLVLNRKKPVEYVRAAEMVQFPSVVITWTRVF